MLDVLQIDQKIPISRQPGVYGYIIPQLNLIETANKDYFLEWFVPGHLNRQTTIHLFTNNHSSV